MTCAVAIHDATITVELARAFASTVVETLYDGHVRFQSRESSGTFRLEMNAIVEQKGEK